MPGTEGTVCACRLIAGSHRVWGIDGMHLIVYFGGLLTAGMSGAAWTRCPVCFTPFFSLVEIVDHSIRNAFLSNPRTCLGTPTYAMVAMPAVLASFSLICVAWIWPAACISSLRPQGWPQRHGWHGLGGVPPSLLGATSLDVIRVYRWRCVFRVGCRQPSDSPDPPGGLVHPFIRSGVSVVLERWVLPAWNCPCPSGCCRPHAPGVGWHRLWRTTASGATGMCCPFRPGVNGDAHQGCGPRNAVANTDSSETARQTFLETSWGLRASPSS